MKKLSKTLMLLLCLFGGAISANAQNHYAEFVTNVAKANAWDWGVTYKLTTPLESGKTYVLTVDASCSDPSYTSLAFWPYKTGDGGKTNYTGFGIDGNLQNRRCEFTAADDLDRLVFNFGQMNGRLVLDNIKLVEKDVEGDLLNIDFESGFDSNWDFGWNKPTAYAVVDEYNPNANHYFKLEKAAGTANAWDRNFTCKLETPLENGETYVLTMKAKSSYYGGGDVPFWPYNDQEGGKTLYTGVHVEADWADCTKEFTANDNLNVITFKLGQMSGDFCVDDIKLVKKGTDVNLLPNGSDFEVGGRLPITGWYAEVGWQQEEYDLAQIVDGFEDFKAEAVSAEVVATDAPWYRKIDGVYTLYTSNNDGGKSYNVGSETGCYFGKYWNGENLEHYADLTNYSHIRVYQASNANVPRAFFVNAGATGHQQVTGFVWNAAGGYYEFDLALADAAVGNRHLTTLRPTSNGTCTAVQFVDPSLQSDVAYILTGDPINGNTDASATAALADASAKIYDATGLTNYEAATLSAANPNAVFVTTEGKLANASNVMVGTTIANLALTDGHDFAVPAGATATAASYDRVVTAAYATVCLPFAAEFTGDAYEYTEADNEAVTFTEVNAMQAGKAYLVKAGFAVTGGSGALAAAADDAFHGTYTATTVPAGSYGFSNGEFVKITGTVTCGAFRAYLAAPSNNARLNLNLGTTTAINALVNELNATAEVYNEAGVLQSSLQKGINIVKLSNGKTQKVIIK